MYKSLAYKEWLKLRLVALVALGIEVIALLIIFSNLRAAVEFNSAFDIWSVVVNKSYMFFGPIKYIPLFIGLLIGVFQYLPEILDMKLKLTLHLPLKEKNVFIFLNMFGTLILLGLFLPIIILLILGSSLVFPSEITYATILTIIPWFLAAFISYYFVAAIMIEPLWMRRIVISVVAFILVNPLLLSSGYSAFQLILFPLFLIVLAFTGLHILSGLRFKRGAK